MHHRGTVGPSYTLFFVPSVLPSIYSLLSTYLLLCDFALFNSCCSYVQVFEKALVHEFHISPCHTEWCSLNSLGELVLSVAVASPLRN